MDMAQTTAVNYLSSDRLNRLASIFQAIEMQEGPLASNASLPKVWRFNRAVMAALKVEGFKVGCCTPAELTELEDENFHALVYLLRAR